jgi:single-strand DNA-binding protein
MLNRIILIGRLATDPELKYTPSGIAVTQFRLAVDRPMSAEARQNGQEKQADFISIVAWRQSAEFAANYLGKGRLVAVEGRLQVREYVTQDGQKRRDAEVVADNLKSLDKPKEGAENGAGREYNGGGAGGGRYEDEPVTVAAAPAAAPRSATPAAPAPNRRPAAAAPAGRYQPSDEELDDPFADN